MVEKQVDEATHTGQQWSADDIRSARFMNRTKQARLKMSLSELLMQCDNSDWSKVGLT